MESYARWSIHYTEDEKDDDESLTTPTSASSSSSDTPEFYEGLLLAVLFHKLETFFENSFTTNLRLTSVLARLCYCPHPLVHAYLLDPGVAIKSSTRHLIWILRKVMVSFGKT